MVVNNVQYIGFWELEFFGSAVKKKKSGKRRNEKRNTVIYRIH